MNKMCIRDRGNVSALKTNQQVINYVAENPGAMGVIGVNWLGDRSDTTLSLIHI